MSNFKVAIDENQKRKIEIKPVLFSLSNETDVEKVEQLLKNNHIQHIVDDYEEQQLELFSVNNPAKVYNTTFKEEFREYYNGLQMNSEIWKHGNWVYYPWNSTLVHILTEQDFQAVRTNRNKNLINQQEQDKFYNSTIGIGGLSVGSNIAFALVLQGGGKRMKLADMDRLALSNTNRILTGVDNLGLYKVDMAAKTIYEINPYAEIETFPEGLTEENIETFCKDLDVMIDELDSFPVKYQIREMCKKYGIPLVQAADNGDNGVMDIERYDLDKDMPFFHGRLGEVTYEGFKNLDKFGIGKTITQLVGPENVTVRMQESLLQMGKTIVSWPQLGGAALLNGAAVAYAVRKILNDEPLEQNRSLLNMDAMLDPTHNSTENIAKRNTITDGFKKMYGI